MDRMGCGSGAIISQADRPMVAARRVREASWSLRELTTVRGSPVPNGVQVVPPLVVAYTPISVATYSQFNTSGSTTRSSAGIFGRLPLISVQVAPALVVLKI